MSKTIEFSVGDIDIRLFSDGLFRLDGGAMFGVVPETMWERRTPCDDENRITLGLISALVTTPKETVLIEAGIGNHFDEKSCGIYCVDHSSSHLLKSLDEAGIKTTDIDRVILSHMHFDHIGHSTRRDESGEFTPTFENAVYTYQKAEWEFAHDPPARVKASYLPHLYDPVEKSGRMELVEGDVEITPGIRSIVTGGHTKGHQVLVIESNGHGAIFWADLIPTSAHTDYPFVMGYDLWPLDTLAAKEKLIPWSVESGYLSIFTHEPEFRYGKIIKDPAKRYHEFMWL